MLTEPLHLRPVGGDTDLEAVGAALEHLLVHKIGGHGYLLVRKGISSCIVLEQNAVRAVSVAAVALIRGFAHVHGRGRVGAGNGRRRAGAAS